MWEATECFGGYVEQWHVMCTGKRRNPAQTKVMCYVKRSVEQHIVWEGRLGKKMVG